MILDGGPCQVGLESTIVGCIGDSVTILRPGGIPLPAIEEVLQRKVEVADNTSGKIRVSGSLLSHYAPVTPLELCPRETLWQRACELEALGLRVATLEWSAPDTVHSEHAGIMRTALPANPVAFGQLLYSTLHQLDGGQFDRLVAETPPQTAEWMAVADRLLRASYRA